MFFDKGISDIFQHISAILEGIGITIAYFEVRHQALANKWKANFHQWVSSVRQSTIHWFLKLKASNQIDDEVIYRAATQKQETSDGEFLFSLILLGIVITGTVVSNFWLFSTISAIFGGVIAFTLLTAILTHLADIIIEILDREMNNRALAILGLALAGFGFLMELYQVGTIHFAVA